MTVPVVHPDIDAPTVELQKPSTEADETVTMSLLPDLDEAPLSRNWFQPTPAPHTDIHVDDAEGHAFAVHRLMNLQTRHTLPAPLSISRHSWEGQPGYLALTLPEGDHVDAWAVALGATAQPHYHGDLGWSYDVDMLLETIGGDVRVKVTKPNAKPPVYIHSEEDSTWTTT